MIYDFETLVSRKNTGSGKWDEMTKEHPNLPENVAPLSVADMELKNPPEIVEGLKKYIDTQYPRLYRPHRGILRCGMRLDEASQRLEY